MSIRLHLTGAQHAQLMGHLFPGDGKEAVALGLCGRQRHRDAEWFLLRDLFPVPYEECVRRGDSVTWPTANVLPVVNRALKEGGAIVKFHGHPGGFDQFSQVDDESDRILFAGIDGMMGEVPVHASVICLPDGRLLGRAVRQGRFSPLDRIMVVGERILVFGGDRPWQVPEHGVRMVQAFGEGTWSVMGGLTVAVVGCSGTGSLVAEQLARSGVKRLVLIDPKPLRAVNLGRVLYSTQAAVQEGRSKVDVVAEGIRATGLGTEVVTFKDGIWAPDVARAVATADVLFGCMDGAEGRHLLNRIATFYLRPYIDLGVRLSADGRGGVDELAGAVHYLQPGGSSLLSRGVFGLERVREEALHREDPAHYVEMAENGYVRGVAVDRPAVMPLNMVFSGLAVMELFGRLHGYRDEEDAFAEQRLRLDSPLFLNLGDGEPCAVLARHLGRGDVVPLLGLPAMSEPNHV